MDRQTIEDGALHLSKEDRVQLIQLLALSLDSPTPDELRTNGLSEAQHRAKELDDGAA